MVSESSIPWGARLKAQPDATESRFAEWVPKAAHLAGNIALESADLPAFAREKMTCLFSSAVLSDFWDQLSKAATKKHRSGVAAFPLVAARSIICAELIRQHRRRASEMNLLSGLASDLVNIARKLAFADADEVTTRQVEIAIRDLPGAALFRPLLAATSRRLLHHADPKVCDLSPEQLASTSMILDRDGADQTYFTRSILIFYRDTIGQPLRGSTATLLRTLYPESPFQRDDDFVKRHYKQLAVIDSVSPTNGGHLGHLKQFRDELRRFIDAMWLYQMMVEGKSHADLRATAVASLMCSVPSEE